MNSRSGGRAALAGVLLSLAACAAGGGWVRDHPDIARRAQEAPESFDAPAYSRWDGMVGLTGSYTLRASRGIGRRAIDTLIAAQRPANLDIVFYDPTGAIQAYLRANADEVGVYFSEDRVLYRGPSSRDSFARALGLPMAPEDAVAVVLGYGVDRLARGEPASSWDPAERRIRLDFGSELSAWLHPALALIEHLEHRDSRGRVETTLAGWVETEAAAPVPTTVQMRLEPDGLGLEWTLVGAANPNPAFPLDFFELQVPAGALQLPLTELARDGGLLQRAEPPGEDDRR